MTIRGDHRDRHCDHHRSHHDNYHRHQNQNLNNFNDEEQGEGKRGCDEEERDHTQKMGTYAWTLLAG